IARRSPISTRSAPRRTRDWASAAAQATSSPRCCWGPVSSRQSAVGSRDGSSGLPTADCLLLTGKGEAMKETKSGGVTIRYEDLGQGEPALLMMPAWCMSHAGFGHLPEKLAARRRVLAVDWRGHGA